MSNDLLDNTNKNKRKSLTYLNILLSTLAVSLTIYSYIVLFSRILSVFLIFIVGLVMLALLIIMAVFSLGFIFSTQFGMAFFEAFKAVWRGEAINNITQVLFATLPYTLSAGIFFTLVSIAFLIFSKYKSKKCLIFSIISFILLILLLILRLCVGVI